MVTRGCAAEEAFEYLSRTSNRTDRMVRDLAAEIVAGVPEQPATPRS